jgi:hypothetical protein
MPVAGGDDEFERVEDGVDRPGDLVPLGDGQGAAGGEVVLEVHDQKGVHRASVEPPSGPPATRQP